MERDGLETLPQKLKQSRQLPDWLWYVIAKCLGVKVDDNDKPILATLLYSLSFASAIGFVLSNLWFVAYDIVSERSKTTVIDGTMSVLFSTFWAAFGMYGNRLSSRVYSQKSFMNMLRLHSKSVFKMNTSVLIFLLMLLFVLCDDINAYESFKDHTCQKVEVSVLACKISYISRVVFSIFFLIWTYMVAFVVVSICRTHTISIRRFMQALDEDATVYEKQKLGIRFSNEAILEEYMWLDEKYFEDLHSINRTHSSSVSNQHNIYPDTGQSFLSIPTINVTEPSAGHLSHTSGMHCTGMDNNLFPSIPTINEPLTDDLAHSSLHDAHSFIGSSRNSLNHLCEPDLIYAKNKKDCSISSDMLPKTLHSQLKADSKVTSIPSHKPQPYISFTPTNDNISELKPHSNSNWNNDGISIHSQSSQLSNPCMSKINQVQQTYSRRLSDVSSNVYPNHGKTINSEDFIPTPIYTIGAETHHRNSLDSQYISFENNETINNIKSKRRFSGRNNCMMKNSEILYYYWKIQTHLRQSSKAFQRWMLSLTFLVSIWLVRNLVLWLTFDPSLIDLADFFLPVIMLPILSSSYAEVNQEGIRLLKFLYLTEDRLVMVDVISLLPLKMNMYGFTLSYSLISSLLFGVLFAFASKSIIRDLNDSTATTTDSY